MKGLFDRTALGFLVPASHFNVEDIPDLTGKVAIVTGANTGLGKASATHLLAHGATVYAAGRSEEKCLQAIGDIKSETGKTDIHFLKLDLSDIRQSYEAGEQFAKNHDRLDILMNSAGVMTPPKGSKTADGYDLQFGTNCIGHYAFTKPLLPLLSSTAKTAPANSVRIVWLSSAAHFVYTPTAGIDFESITDTDRKSSQEHYGQSKLGDIHLANECAERLRGDGVISVSLHPGNISTELARHSWFIQKFVPLYPPSKGCLTQLYAATSPEVTIADTGSYYVPWARKYQTSHPKANDVEAQKATWEYCEAQVQKVLSQSSTS